MKIYFPNHNILLERKYNQVGYVRNVLGKLENLTYHNDKLWFDEDVKKKFQKELDNKLIDRNRYLDEKAKEILENENFKITGNKMTCMVNNIVYPTLISSHIKRSVKCDRNEKYDHKNLILRNPNATRPWQHVLDVLNGYIKLAIKLKI